MYVCDFLIIDDGSSDTRLSLPIKHRFSFYNPTPVNQPLLLLSCSGPLGPARQAPRPLPLCLHVIGPIFQPLGSKRPETVGGYSLTALSGQISLPFTSRSVTFQVGRLCAWTCVLWVDICFRWLRKLPCDVKDGMCARVARTVKRAAEVDQIDKSAFLGKSWTSTGDAEVLITCIFSLGRENNTASPFSLYWNPPNCNWKHCSTLFCVWVQALFMSQHTHTHTAIRVKVQGQLYLRD